MERLRHGYQWLFNDAADPRVKHWFLMDGPIPLVSILTLYLLAVKVLIPKYMERKRPYNLKTIIRWYNVFQVFVNSVLFWGFLTSGWLTTLTFGCELPSYGDDPESVRTLNWMYWTTIVKIIDLVETLFFVLRKKNNQASLLHIYHHMMMPTVLWIGTKYVSGGLTSLTPLINSLVHVIMYAYYLLAAEAGKSLRIKLNKWKMWITVIQMVQFTILFIHSLQTFLPSCPAPKIIAIIYTPNVVIIYYLFLKFFIETYLKKSSKKTP